MKPCPTCKRILVVHDPNIGHVVQGKWRLERRLGQGGMGSVYLATELLVDRPVALKFLHAQLAEREEYRSRFEQEARIMARVEHPNLAHLYGVERDGTVPFLVMRYVPGKPLSRVMKERRELPLVEALSIVVQVAAALSALHARGYVHRDLKPGNIIVADDGHVTLLDFGLTRTHNPNLTRPGIALGSPQYMSPEQVLAGSLDGRSDLYTLGLLTSELLTGRRPYKDATTREILLQHLHETPEPAHVTKPGLPEAVSAVLLKAMSKRPQDRQESVEAFVESLVQSARAGPVTLPRRETAEAMLAQASAVRPPKPPDGPEVAEVLPPETLSFHPPEPEKSATPAGRVGARRATPERTHAALQATIVDLPPVDETSPRLNDDVPLRRTEPMEELKAPRLAASAKAAKAAAAPTRDPAETDPFRSLSTAATAIDLSRQVVPERAAPDEEGFSAPMAIALALMAIAILAAAWLLLT